MSKVRTMTMLSTTDKLHIQAKARNICRQANVLLEDTESLANEVVGTENGNYVIYAESYLASAIWQLEQLVGALTDEDYE